MDVVAEFIESRLRGLGRITVQQSKIKFGTVRVYIQWGISDFHELFYPGHHYVRFTGLAKSIYYATIRQQTFLFRWLVNSWLVPYQQWVYRKTYEEAIRRWPGYADAIVSGMDCPELLGKEVTESIAMHELNAIINVAEALQEFNTHENLVAWKKKYTKVIIKNTDKDK